MAGHEWSPGGTPLGTEMLWWRSLRPRLHALLPTGTLLEIAPGFGRWTEYLIRESRDLVGIDATERCVDVCRERFAGRPARFSLNDGRTLPMVRDASVDAAFSFDSLVHVDRPDIAAYLSEVARCLKPGGMGFFHHSNLGAYADPSTGSIPAYVTRKGWRAESMSARAFRDGCRDAGLYCVSQEIVTWRIRGDRPYRLRGERLPLTDCFSLFTRSLQPNELPRTKVYVNRHFVQEWDEVTCLADLYVLRDSPMTSGRNGAAAAPRRVGTLSAARHAWRIARGRFRRAMLARRDPILTALRTGRCPDCSLATVPGGLGRHCTRCDVTFIVA